ncbi:DUF3541 domain-containing protein [Shewanella sp.]|uniref:DUF3541 domain-containing protein n=1 Tax=Shewanella sp. TaxID=50422 RepID=UPI00258F4CB3|nr:DUF3541 domain-containing protein [Shewanella sp.]MCJ8304787.1 DUF3541 domain-containing protein [Shewanella sp.]
MAFLTQKNLLKISTLSLALFSLSAASAVIDPSQIQNDKVYQGIKNNLELHLYQLPPRVQGHYGIRLYRMTGDEKYANAALVDLYAVTESQAFYACSLEKPGFITTEAEKAISVLGKGPRAKARKKALEPFPEFLFYTDVLLRFSSRIDEFGLTGPCNDKLITALKKTDLKTGLTDKAMIKSWAAQLINYAYWAKQLGVGDYVNEYKQAFIAVYPNDKDSELNKKQYQNKLYGLTHFIFAASEYYQHDVSPKEFSWILDYFEDNIDRILEDATDDIIAEVGISFHLAGLSDNPVVAKTQAHIVNAFDESVQFIRSPMGNPDLALGEHRNVLAMMLLNWPQKLHKGPYFTELKATKKYLPKQVSVKLESSNK